MALYPNSPNPFNPRTTIAFELVRPELVRLRVFDMSGRLVKTLIHDEIYVAGRHETVWHGRDGRGRLCASGNYFYRLDTESLTETKRMVLLR